MPNLMQTELLDVVTNNAETGFRLEKIEVYNWGTFDKHVWLIKPGSQNSLLTGDIGSGKSTIVDAITTLLVPHHRIVYNKAAGADGKERNLYSYIRGEYKNEKDDFTQSAKAISLRDENHYTVLLAYFYNSGFSQGVTLAQVFWLKDNKRNPEKFFVISQQQLSITEHFSGFESDILKLKKQLRQHPDIELFDQFKEYSSRFRHLFGIHNEQALDLFYQTVSMKSVGNLTDFVRNHMLEKYDIEFRVNELRINFDNLNRAYEAVLKSKKQVEMLKPLAVSIHTYENLGNILNMHSRCRDLLPAYFAAIHVELLNENIHQLNQEIEIHQQKRDNTKNEIERLRIEENKVRKHIDDNGGQRLQVIEQEISRLSIERDKAQDKYDHYHELVGNLKLTKVTDENQFYNNLQDIKALLAEQDQLEKDIQIRQVDLRIDIKAAENQQNELKTELDSLKSRKTNIPTQMLRLRQDMLSILKLDEEQLPFVGELLQVAEQEEKWQGAIERLLHNFGLSLLVSDKYYAEVNHYVERTQLKGRLIYYRIKEDKHSSQPLQIEPRSLMSKLYVKPDTAFTAWLEQELLQRFHYTCCDSIDELRLLPQGMTMNGLIKSKGQRHEKDDRHALNDRSRYILGWNNQNKINALSQQLQKLEQHGAQLVEQLASIVKQQQSIRDKRDTCRDLLSYNQFSQINWQAYALQIKMLSDEKQEIEKSSDILKTLKLQLEKIKQLLNRFSNELSELEQTLGGKRQKLEDSETKLKQVNELAGKTIEESYKTKLKELKDSILAASLLTLDNINIKQQEISTFIQKQIDKDQQAHKNLTGNITRQMQTYKATYPADTMEIDASTEAAPDYLRLLQLLENEDLPRHEKRFKELLNEGTINSIALFQNQLNREKQEIEERIRKINLSLREIEYSTGTYIELLMNPVQDVEIRDFQQDLRQCLQNTLSNQNYYDEEKFLQVKTIIERFNGRENKVDIDRKWTQKVCDVRNWFSFSASERWIENNTEKEFYSDSSGKSGGQKEKLAYTILASALAYQFGLEWGVTTSRSFRFVVIDEAFGKGSNDSTRYGLELFKKMNLQLLIVTPLQKIHVIEDYIHSVHYVENRDGCRSVVRNLTIEELKKEKQAFLEAMNDLSRTDQVQIN